ncbi:hypothetical protein ASPZODRAFT_55876 [Penicilliopsis zonata CBS 506.65]|uniref:DUF7703 domain-containing protein n=1 Tax=Penicilliopsis zonata CBS 506.65 TaxID=1073090 RepID=A0A1L9SU43_9EURO|nr:hypothetical protein ASPZODRAFT_55876 [Penicilliopsis zonata CBS 506.65]OJJ50722.1 hypothetical protein ASPZODRAFT_55876 [Penicilliopsis zonata CBS 506.65]
MGPEKLAVTVLFAIALYNSIELVILVFVTFTRYTGLYFWSLLLSAVLGVIPHALGYMLNFFRLAPDGLAITMSTIGYWFMVPGQSVVLYSRLHLVVQDPQVLRRMRLLIIVGSIVFIIPTTVTTYGTVFTDNEDIIRAYNVIERMQLTWFCIQEFILAGIYIYQTVRLLRLNPDKTARRRKIMYELLAINVVIILMDISLLVIEYLGLYVIQVTLKSAVYSIKLKLEFAVLGKLVSLVNLHAASAPTSAETGDFPTFVDPSQIHGDITHATATTPTGRGRSPRSPWHTRTISLESLPASVTRARSALSDLRTRNAVP